MNTLTAARKKTLIEKIFVQSNFPARFFEVEEKDIAAFGVNEKERDFNAKALKTFFSYLEKLEDNLRKGNSLAICGGAGLGKTRLLSYLGRRCIELFIDEVTGKDTMTLRRQACFILASELSDLTFNRNDPLRQHLFHVHVLVIDDITKLVPFKGGQEVVFLDRILRTRYHNRLPTFLTSQYPFEKLNEALSEPIFDLLYEMAITVTLVGDSFRRVAQ